MYTTYQLKKSKIVKIRHVCRLKVDIQSHLKVVNYTAVKLCMHAVNCVINNCVLQMLEVQ